MFFFVTRFGVLNTQNLQHRQATRTKERDPTIGMSLLDKAM